MTRQEAIDYLTYRMELANNHQGIFNDRDVLFIREYINHIHGKLVGIDSIVNSIHMYPAQIFMYYFDTMLNHVILHFNIELKTELASAEAGGFSKIIGYI